ncbi:MAG: tripartite tricarboxylate transporter TctB family protein [Alphaproteobacteria bacterium]|nr:tripartite tricarboxylate transporter TctB family protein [Alphaproteobacteria bacterium]TAD91563.1 MAG: tripartite tricarboxylate transporter TctB family protein [Alphaproteobacteria bacterium]
MSSPVRRGISVRSWQDLAGGLTLLALALLALYLIRELPLGRAVRMGPGYLPTLLAYCLGGLGALLVGRCWLTSPDQLEAWSIRNLAIVLGAIILFGLTLREAGLVISAFLLTFVSAFAARDVRWKESAAFSVGLVLFGVLVFVEGLGLPLTIWPRWFL